MEIKQWAICYEWSGGNPDKLRSALEANDLFGTAETRKWHRSRGSTRMLAPPRGRWAFGEMTDYALIVGFMTDDQAIADRFRQILESVS